MDQEYDGTTHLLNKDDFVKPKTLIMKTAQLEAATEAVAAAMGGLSTKILLEEEKEFPNQQLIQEMESKMEEIQRERNSLDPDDEAAITALLKKYGTKKRRAQEVSDDLQP